MAAGGDRDQAAPLAYKAETLIAQIATPYWRAVALTALADEVASCGDYGRATRLAGEAKALSRRTDETELHERTLALVELAKAVASSGDQDRAEVLTAQITEPYWKTRALARVVEAAAASDNHDRAARLASEAKALAVQITEPNWRAWALVRLTRIFTEISKEASPVTEHARSSSPLTVQVRHLLAAALVTGSWTRVVADLARVDPLAATALADEVQKRWRLQSPGLSPGTASR